MKRIIAIFAVFALLCVCIPAVGAAGDNDIEISVAVPESAKIGESWHGVVPEVTVEGNVYGCALKVGKEASDAYFECGWQPHIASSNYVELTLRLYPDISDGSNFMIPDIYGISFAVNGKTLQPYEVRTESNEWGEHYFIRCSMELSVAGRTTYSITPDETVFDGGYSIRLNSMVREAEAGANVCFNASFESDFNYRDIYSVDYYTVNGKKINCGEYFEMPAENVTVAANVTDRYEGWKFVPDIDITLDFEDDEIYYGKKVPTTEDFLEALRVSSSDPKAGVKVSFAVVDTLYDEATGGDMPWVGNQFLTFQIEADEGYLISNPYLPEYSVDEFGNESFPLEDWLYESLDVKVNGVERGFALSMRHTENRGLVNAVGYMVSDYYVTERGIELHVHWSFEKEVDFDLSPYKAGDTVTIPDSVWVWDGYMPTGYSVTYYSDEMGEMTEKIYGKTFVMPDADSEVVLKASAIRGMFNSSREPDEIDFAAPVAVKQSLDSENIIDLSFEEGTFEDITVLQINKITGDDFYGAGYEILDMVNRVLSDVANDSVTFDITALSYNEEVQPTKKIVVTFPIPEGFDSEYIAFCHVDEGGSYEIVPTEIDVENGVCRAVIDHFSTYAIVSLKAEKDILSGDINGDGTVNAIDSNLIKRVIAGTLALTEEQMKACDVFEDGSINSIDSNMISRIIAGNN